MALSPTYVTDNEKLDEEHLMDVFQIPEMTNDYLEIDQALFSQIERDLIELFIKTYSAYHIRNFSQVQKESLIKSLWNNNTLVTLIKNLDIQPKSYQVEFLEGPTHFCLYQFNNKTIYLLGEYHTNTNGHCIKSGMPTPPTPVYGIFPRQNKNTSGSLRIIHFIDLLSRETPSFFDFYLETGLEDLYDFHDGYDVNISVCFIIVFFYIYYGGQDFGILHPSNFIDQNKGYYILNSLFNIAANYYNSIGSPPIPFAIQTEQSLMNEIQNLLNSFRFEYQGPNGELFQIQHYFRSCFNPSSRKKQYINENCKLGRFHNVDGRKIIQSNLETLLIVNLLDWLSPANSNELNMYFEPCFELLKNIGIESFLIKILDPSTGTPQHNLFEHIIDNYPEVKKEWNLSLYKKEIRDYIETELENVRIDILQKKLSRTMNLPLASFTINSFMNECLTMFQDPLALTTNKALHQMTYVYMYEVFFRYFCSVMDIYCLSRVFKKFKIKNDCQPEESYNIIIYAGDLHIDIYSKFMRFLGHQPIIERKNGWRLGCVHIGFSSINPIQNLNIQ